MDAVVDEGLEQGLPGFITGETEGEHLLRDRQAEREKGARDAAIGKRARGVLRGNYGPSLQRWANAVVLPVSNRVRVACEVLLSGRGDNLAGVLGSPVFGLPLAVGRSRDLEPILLWCLKGRSPGRGDSTTYADDLVLTVLGTAMDRLMACGDHGIPLVGVIVACGEAARETAIGQFIADVQGAKAMMKLRKGKEHSWQAKKAMDTVAALMAGQLRSGLDAQQLDQEGSAPRQRRKLTVEIITEKGEKRHIEMMRPPEVSDWHLLDVARKVKGERDPHKATWTSFAMMILCAAQAEAGLFDLVKISKTGAVTEEATTRRKRSKGHHGGVAKWTHGLVLSPEARAAVAHDLERWMRLGFVKEPMVVPPRDGGYLTVKTRKVAGSRGPMGIKTDPGGTAAWSVASEIMARTPWQVSKDTLRWIRGTPQGRALAEKDQPDVLPREVILGGYARASEFDNLYMPIMMDFRGRVYTQSTVVTYQGGDLQKGLLRFPTAKGAAPIPGPGEHTALALHLGALYGGPQKLDKAPLSERVEWVRSIAGRATEDVLEGADEPIQLYTALTLLRGQGEWDSIPVQIDGTCNGLQHLTALFRDHDAAPFVNLGRGTFEDRPSDIYAEVASRVSASLAHIEDPWARRLAASVRLDRKLCKKPVMVLPYGGTLGTVEDACLQAILEQSPEAVVGNYRFDPWKECLVPDVETAQWRPDEAALEMGLKAFRDRELKDHPLLHADARRLGQLVWRCITEVIPKPMLAMQAFRDIAHKVGARTLEWDTGFGLTAGGKESLWVVQAKAKSASTKLHLKGFHLPDKIRGMSIRVGRDEVDPTAHVSGLVANFIHSQDARHQTATMATFGHPCFGGIFDCYITRPSLMGELSRAARVAFYEQYAGKANHPLLNKVRLRDVSTGKVTDEYHDWYDLATAFGVSFPESGVWDPAEVLDSAWFFS